MTPYLELSACLRGVKAIAGVNDAPLIQSDSLGRVKQTRYPLNLWLMPGQNLLTVRVEPHPAAESPPLVDVAIAFPGDAEPPPCRLGWALPLEANFKAFNISLPFHPPKPTGSRVWRDAAQIEKPAEEHLKDARALGISLYQGFAAADIDAIMSLLQYRLEEMCLAFEMNLSAHRGEVQGDITELVSGAGFGMTPLEAEAIQVNPCCGGRVFELAREDGSPLIKTLETETSAPSTMQVFAALVDGKWRIVR